MWHQVIPLWEVKDHPTTRSWTQLSHLLPNAPASSSWTEGETHEAPNYLLLIQGEMSAFRRHLRLHVCQSGQDKGAHISFCHWTISHQVDSINDNEELQFTDSAFDIIGFSESEKWNCYKVRLTTSVWSNFVSADGGCHDDGGDEVQAERKRWAVRARQKQRQLPEGEWRKIQLFSLFQVAELTEVDVSDLMTAFVKPRIKVSTSVFTFWFHLYWTRLALSGWRRVRTRTNHPMPLEELPEQSTTEPSFGWSRSATRRWKTPAWRKSTSVPSLTSPALRSSPSTALSSSRSTLSMRSCSSSSTITCKYKQINYSLKQYVWYQ